MYILILQGKLYTKIYDNGGDSFYLIDGFPFGDSNVPLALSNGVNIAQLVCYVCVFGVVIDRN